MPATTPTFRLFVSSTFDDLVEERNALHTDVFPKLHRLCTWLESRFQAVDLRWGVREEAHLDQRTMEICFAEIDRCRRTNRAPNFIVILGDRYGWCPLPYRIDAREFDMLVAAIRDPDDRELVEQWYELDRNAVPPERLLRPRRGDDTAWPSIEDRLRATLRSAARRAGLSAGQLVKYEASATHQEVLHRLSTASEADRRNVFAFFREPTDAVHPDLETLKTFLRGALPAANIVSFRKGDHAGLCRAVEANLSGVMRKAATPITFQDEVEARERDAHDAFARERAAFFAGRGEIQREIRDYTASEDRRPLVVFGPSGSGKSAIIARASEGIDAVRRFVGATPDSTGAVELLRSICAEIDHRYESRDEIPTTFDRLTVVFAQRMKLATAARPLLVFIDALDQLEAGDPAAALNWLPPELPPHCRLIVSTIGVPAALRRARLVEVTPLPAGDAEQALDAWLAASLRTLQPAQREAVLASFAGSGLPLHLKLAFEEARLWKSLDPPDHHHLDHDLPGLIDQLFARLSDESNHGEILVSHALAYLVAARYGLADGEMLELLTEDEEVWADVVGEGERRRHDPPERRLPAVVWSRLYLDLEPYLMERSVPGATTIAFYHRQLAERAASRYLGSDARTERYRLLTEYFSRWRSETRDKMGFRFPNRRKLSELPYQLTMSGDWDAVDRLLTDMHFLDVKARSGAIRDLVEDYVRATTLRAASAPEDPPWIEFQRFVTAEADLIERYGPLYPQIFFQQAFNQAKSGRLHEACEELLRAGNGPEQYWIERVNRPQQPRVSSCVFAFADHPAQVYAVAFSPGGRAIATTSASAIEVRDTNSGIGLRTLEGHEGAVLDLAWIEDDVLLSASWDGTVRVWNPGTGDCERVLAKHEAPVTTVRRIDANRCLTYGFDGSVRVWDFTTGEVAATLAPHASAVVAAFPLDAERIVSAGEDGRIRISSLRGGEPRTLREGDPLTCLAPLGDGRVAAGNREGAIEIWNCERGARESVFYGHRGPIAGIATDRANRIWSWSFDYMIRRWSAAGKSELVLTDHDSAVTQAVFLGDWLITGSQDATLRAWDLESGDGKAVLRGHRAWITALAVGGARRIASGSWDRTMRVWDVAVAVSAPPEDLSAIVPDIAQAQRLTTLVVTHATRAISVTSGPGHAQVWDLESGECVRVADREGSAEEKEAYAVLRRTIRETKVPWTYVGRENVHEWGLELDGATHKDRHAIADGIACLRARSTGDGMWEAEQRALAFYPLQTRPYAPVFESDRTIAFDALTREAHILRLRTPPPRK